MSDHGHGHGHGIPTGGGSRRPLIMALAISATILVVEVVGAVLTGSLALLADAGHMLTDVAGLSLAVAATVLAARESTPERTWGFLRAEVLAAAQAALLLAVGAFVLIEAVTRLFEPPEVASGAMVIFGLVGWSVTPWPSACSAAAEATTSTPGRPSSKSSTMPWARSPCWSPPWSSPPPGSCGPTPWPRC